MKLEVTGNPTHTHNVPCFLLWQAPALLLSNFSGKTTLRGAWRDQCFPEPFSWFLHEPGKGKGNYLTSVAKQVLKVWRLLLHAVFYWNVEGKTRKKRKNTASFVASLGAGVQPRSTVQLFMLVSGVEKRRFGSFSRLRSVIWRGKAFREQQCQFLTRNKSLSSENESNCSMTSECVRTDSILLRGAGLEHARWKQSIFSLSIFSAFWSNGLASSAFIFAPILLQFFFIVFIYARAKIRCYRFFNFDLRKKLCCVKADRVG